MINDRNQRDQDVSKTCKARTEHAGHRLSRRQFLRAGLGATTALALPALAGCENQPPAPTPTVAPAAATTAPTAVIQNPTSAPTLSAAATAAPTATPPPPTPTPPLAPQPRVIQSVDGVLETSFRVQLLEHPPIPGGSDQPVMLRTYAVRATIDSDTWEPSIPGPTLRFRRGDLFRLELINDLEPNPAEHTCDPANVNDIYPECFHDPNTTNIHYHGSHTFPELPGDDVLFSIPPGSQQDYRYVIHERQAPGTHWYHPHNHGSTAIQVLNGMAGAYIVEGDFDSVPEIAEAVDLVFVLQQIAPNLNFPPGSGGGAPRVLVNGVANPAVIMRPGEVQRWRFIGATMQASGIVALAFDTSNGASEPPGMYQIAMDGVQFNNDQWDPDTPVETFTIAAGNRADFLVKAPDTPGQYTLVPRLAAPRPIAPAEGGNAPTPTPLPPQENLLTVEVKDDGTIGYPTTLPAKGSFPELPPFLQPITDEELTDSQGQQRKRCLVFSVVGNPGQQPKVYIDCKQFDPSVIDHCMAINTAEEWTIYNVSTLVHPFHIHINPFMVTNIHDPTTATQSVTDSQPMRWQDTILLPPAKVNGSQIDPGSVTIRHRFLDFTGEYVLHCHILGHEDRGMMQAVETVESEDLCPPGARWQDKQQCATCPAQGVPEGVLP